MENNRKDSTAQHSTTPQPQTEPKQEILVGWEVLLSPSWFIFCIKYCLSKHFLSKQDIQCHILCNKQDVIVYGVSLNCFQNCSFYVSGTIPSIHLLSSLPWTKKTPCSVGTIVKSGFVFDCNKICFPGIAGTRWTNWTCKHWTYWGENYD
jgi:hypothetical protein